MTSARPTPPDDRRAAPYEPGNLAALKHGARSARVVKPLAAEIAADLLRRRPDLVDRIEVVRKWAEATARCRLIDRWLSDVGLIDEAKGDVRASRDYGHFSNVALHLGDELGLTPVSYAQLQKARQEVKPVDRQAILEAILERGRASIAAREARDAHSQG